MNRFTPIRDGLTFVWIRLPAWSRFELALAMMAMAAAARLNAQIPIILGSLVSNAQDSMASGIAWGLATAQAGLIAMGACFIGRDFIGLMRKLIVHKVCTSAEQEMHVATVSRLLRLNVHDVRVTPAGELQGRLRSAVDGYVKLIRVGFSDFLPAFLTAAFAVMVAFSRSSALGWLILAAIIALLTVVLFQGASQQGKRVAIMDGKNRISGTVIEQIGGIEQIRVLNTHDWEVAKISGAANQLRNDEMRHHQAMAGFDFGKSVVELVFFVGVTALSIAEAESGKIPLGDIVTATILFGSVLTPIREIHRIIDEVSESSLAVAKLRQLFSKPLDRAFTVMPVAAQAPIKAPAISACGLTVTYAGKGAAIRNLTLRIPVGEFVGIVGATGSGKSTLVKTIERIVHPSDGDMMMFGRPIDSFSPKEISEVIGVVSQNPFLFSGSLYDNIIYGGPIPTNDQLMAAITAAALEKDLEALGGLNRQIDERGDNLAGGQRQRIALTRVLLNPKPLLIFDEATSALDNTNEASVLAAITAFKGKATVIMVAHRLSTLRSADRILVFERGEIVEDGTYHGLAETGGHFSQLLRAGEQVVAAA